MNIIEFFVNTYEEDIGKQRSRAKDATDLMFMRGAHDNGVNNSDEPRRGRKPNDRIPYLASHPKQGIVQRILQRPGHNNLPNFIGHYFPRRDDTETQDLYYASMLMLLKPWRNIVTDLKDTEQTWKEAFHLFVNESGSQGKRVNDILSGIQYFHDCESSSDLDQRPRDGNGHSGALEIIEDGLADELREQFEVGLTEEALQDAIAAQTPINEALMPVSQLKSQSKQKYSRTTTQVGRFRSLHASAMHPGMI